MTSWLLTLAEAPPNPPPAGGEGGLLQLIYMFGPLIVIFLVINHLLISRPQRREQQRHQEMIANLKKNDRVLTSGGIVGTFVSMSEDKREVVLRVDDNTRIRFCVEYIRGKLDDSAESSNGSTST